MNRALLVPLQLHKQFVRSLGKRQKSNKKDIYRQEGNGKTYNAVIYYKPWVHWVERIEVMCDCWPGPDGLFSSEIGCFIVFHHRFLCFRENFVEPKSLPAPSKLFRVQRIARLKGMIYWERRIIRDLGLEYSVSSLERSNSGDSRKVAAIRCFVCV